MTRQISPEWLRELEELADLGLPVPPTRFRGLKRVVVRLCWVFLHRQVEYNHEVAKSVERVVAEESEARATTVDELRGQIEQLKSDSAVRHDEMLGVVLNELGALRDEVVRVAQGLSNEQVRSGVLEGQAADLSRSLLELEQRVAVLAERFAHTGATSQGPSSEPRD